MEVGTYTCGDDACAEEWQAEIPPLWVPDSLLPACAICGAVGWLMEVIQIVPATGWPFS